LSTPPWDFDQQEPSVAMDSAGNFVIAWQSYGQESASDGIYAQRYNASGVAQGGEFHVNTTTTDNQNLPTVAMDSSGNFVITWESYAQDGSLQGIYGQRYNSSGVAQGGEFRLNTTTANAQQNPVVTMTGGGSFAVTWQSTAQDGSLEGVYMRLYDASGNPVTGETRVNTTTTGDQHSPSIVSNQNGRMVIAWQGNGSGDGDGVFMQRYTYGFPPVLTMSTGSATYVENAAPLSDAGATVTDPNTTVFNGGQLVVQLTSNGTASDELGIRNDGVGAGQIGVSGANVTYGGVVIGTFSGVFGNGSTPLTVTLNGNASVAATQALVRAVTYRDTSDAPSTLTRTLSLTLSDETGWTSNPATISLAVVAQNDAPVHSMPGAQSTPHQHLPDLFVGQRQPPCGQRCRLRRRQPAGQPDDHQWQPQPEPHHRPELHQRRRQFGYGDDLLRQSGQHQRRPGGSGLHAHHRLQRCGQPGHHHQRPGQHGQRRRPYRQ
jgi:hypothetical protein